MLTKSDKLGISRDEVKEIRRVINLKDEDKLEVMTEVSQANGSKNKVLKNVRELYRLQPATV